MTTSSLLLIIVSLSYFAVGETRRPQPEGAKPARPLHDDQTEVWPADRAFYLGEPTNEVWKGEAEVPGIGSLTSIRTEIPKDSDPLEALMIKCGAKKTEKGWDLTAVQIPISEFSSDEWKAILSEKFRKGVSHPKRRDSVRIGNFIFLPPKQLDEKSPATLEVVTPTQYLKRGGNLFDEYNKGFSEYAKSFGKTKYSGAQYKALVAARAKLRLSLTGTLDRMADLGVSYRVINERRATLTGMSQYEDAGDVTLETILEKTGKRLLSPGGKP
ncbi:MAG: hypothetical protein HYZ71_13335 [Deltaproteobacteria bacterium]|nr:hypothetical protein [Deltaproteobacteria bacterium]